jgi:hypothetical protein
MRVFTFPVKCLAPSGTSRLAVAAVTSTVPQATKAPRPRVVAGRVSRSRAMSVGEELQHAAESTKAEWPRALRRGLAEW